MEEYIKRENKRLAKKYTLRTILIILILILGMLLYELYLEIEVQEQQPKTSTTTTVQRTSQTIETVKKQSQTVSDMIEKVTASVVGISKIKNVGGTIFLDGADTKLGLGTGMIVSQDGYILTNEHVSGQKYSSCYVTLENGKSYQGKVVWSDSNIDLSLVKINIKGLPYVTLGDSETVKVGESVYAIGNPIGYEFQRTVTSGIISATNRTIVLEEEQKSSYMENLIQTDATINPGNSGGPLIDVEGKVIGITSVKITSAEGIGFAIPINIVKNIIQSFEKTGKFEEAYLGIFAYDKNVISYLESNLKLENGIYVTYVNKNSPASKAGVKEKDVIVSIDDITLNKMCDLRCYIYKKKPEEVVTLKVLRNHKLYDIKVTLSKK